MADGGLILLDSGVLGLNERVRLGDSTVGWRGDANMLVMADEAEQRVCVLAVDERGDRYIAASVYPLVDKGWQHSLLRKLRDGDWQREDSVDRLMATLQAPHDAADARVDDINNERAEKVAWALKRDLGHLHGGTTREFF